MGFALTSTLMTRHLTVANRALLIAASSLALSGCAGTSVLPGHRRDALSRPLLHRVAVAEALARVVVNRSSLLDDPSSVYDNPGFANTVDGLECYPLGGARPLWQCKAGSSEGRLGPDAPALNPQFVYDSASRRFSEIVAARVFSALRVGSLTLARLRDLARQRPRQQTKIQTDTVKCVAGRHAAWCNVFSHLSAKIHPTVIRQTAVPDTLPNGVIQQIQRTPIVPSESVPYVNCAVAPYCAPPSRNFH